MRSIVLLLLASLWLACDPGSSRPTTSPAKAEPVAHEAELLKLTLSPAAQQRIGIETVLVEEGTLASARRTAGEIVVPPTTVGGMPTGSLANLQQLAAQQVAAEGESARAMAQARLARIALDRSEGLVDVEAGSARARDEAIAALAAAEAALKAAHEQRRLLGPAVASMNAQDSLWVRVSIFGSDLDRIQRGVPVVVRELGEGGTARTAHSVVGPPSANSVAGTVDFFYAIANRDRALRVGQRVAVELPLVTSSTGLVVPSAAIVRDIHGGEWVYERIAPDAYLRQRVEAASERDGTTLLARGLRPGAEVVTAGSAELFGTEFGAAH